MIIPGNQNPGIPGQNHAQFDYPPIPGHIKERYGFDEREVALRTFGNTEKDIQIDFQQKIRPNLVTEILCACTVSRSRGGEQTPREFFNDLTVGKRIQCLAAIVTAGGVSEMNLRLHCREESCKELMEIALTMEDITGMHQSAEEGACLIPFGGRDYTFRKPTARDQMEWLKQTYPGEEAAAEAMMRTLHIPGEATRANGEIPTGSQWITAVNEGMKNQDPLVTMEMILFCPACNKENHYEPDLEELTLTKLHKIQQGQLNNIHKLASRYHWSEAQIMALTPSRRNYYLTLIEKEAAK